MSTCPPVEPAAPDRRPRSPRHRAAGAALAVPAATAAVVESVRHNGSPTSTTAAVIGQAGALSILAFTALLLRRCVRELRAAGAARRPAPTAAFTRGEKVVVFAGAIALQFFVLYFAFLTTGHGTSPADFHRAFVERFTTAGDNPHYLYLAEHGYQRVGEHAKLIVFYPLYPALIWTAHFAVGGYAAAGLFLSWAAWGGACVSMLDLAARRYDRTRAALAVLLLALYPFSFFSMGVYTESVFLLLCAQCLLRIEKRQWAAVGVLGCLAALTRTQGILLVLPAAYCWVLAHRNGAGRRRPDLTGVFLLLIPAGFGAYLLLNRVVAGDWFAYYAHLGAAPWYQSVKWISADLAQHYAMAQQNPGLAPFIYVPQLLLFFVAVALLFYGLIAGAPTHLLLYGGAYVGLCYLSGWLISGPRYMFGCLPLFLLAARPRHRAWQALVPVFSAFLLLCYAVFYMQAQAIF